MIYFEVRHRPAHSNHSMITRLAYDGALPMGHAATLQFIRAKIPTLDAVPLRIWKEGTAVYLNPGDALPNPDIGVNARLKVAEDSIHGHL